jgi:hypothetical protein
MGKVKLNGHTDIIIGKIIDDIRDRLARAVEDAVGEECVTSLKYIIKVDAAPPKRENETAKEAKTKKPIVTVERTYSPPPVKEKDELLVLSVAELPLLDGD